MFNKSLKIIVASSLLILPTTTAAAFKDVGTFHTYQDSINKLATHGCIQGHQDNTFKPDNKSTRAETLKLLMKCIDLPKLYAEEILKVPAGASYLVNGVETKVETNSEIKIKVPFDPNTYPALEFKDITNTEWFVATLKEALVRKLITGYADNTIKGMRTVSKGEFFTMLYRLVPKEFQKVDLSTDLAKDALKGQWYTEGLAFAKQNQFIGPDINGNINPTKELTRAQVAHFIQSYKNWLNQKLNPTIADPTTATPSVNPPVVASPDTTTLEPTTSAAPVLTQTFTVGYKEEGKASFYNTELFSGKRTSAGDIYDPAQLTAAHNDIPFGTIVKVTDTNSSSFVCVRINDRGPNKTIHPDRVIDLSESSFKALADLSKGVIQVKIEIVENCVS